VNPPPLPTPQDPPPLTATSSPTVPANAKVVFGRYELRGILGKGSFGEIFDVKDIHTQEELALKRVPAEITGDPMALQALSALIEKTKSLNHASIASVKRFEHDRTAGHACILSEQIQGKTLAQWLASQRENAPAGAAIYPPLPVILGIAEQIAAALDFAHSQTPPVLHRDLKPNNIILEAGIEYRPGVPYVRITDFGIGAEMRSAMQNLSMVTAQPRAAGKPVYMAPEIWEGRTQGPATDQWALGVILYEMIAGKRPFDAPTEMAIAMQVKECNPEAPANMHPVQWKALKRVFQSNMTLRYPNCTAMVASIESGNEGTEAPPPSPAAQAAGVEATMMLPPPGAQPVPTQTGATPSPALTRSVPSFTKDELAQAQEAPPVPVAPAPIIGTPVNQPAAPAQPAQVTQPMPAPPIAAQVGTSSGAAPAIHTPAPQFTPAIPPQPAVTASQAQPAAVPFGQTSTNTLQAQAPEKKKGGMKWLLIILGLLAVGCVCLAVIVVIVYFVMNK
jgi:serine/threonine-protein kinase